MKSSTKLHLGKMLIPANIMSMLIVAVSIIGANTEMSKINCESDSKDSGYNQSYLQENYKYNNSVEEKKANCYTEFKNVKAVNDQHFTLAIIGYPLVWGLTIFLIITGKKGLDIDRKNYRDPSHGTMPKGYGK